MKEESPSKPKSVSLKVEGKAHSKLKGYAALNSVKLNPFCESILEVSSEDSKILEQALKETSKKLKK